MKVLELFCGTKSISKAFEARGHDTITLDFDDYHKPDILKSILDFEIKDLPKGWRPDVIWASPPCTTFSVASLSVYWISGKPKTSRAYIGLAIALKTIEIIKELNPKYYFIENPRGMLRKQHFMQSIPKRTVTYCRYGAKVQKPTDIWTNAHHWISKKRCSPGDSCHESAKKGEDRGTQHQNRSPIKRAIIPKLLCQEIVDVCENKQKIRQEILI